MAEDGIHETRYLADAANVPDEGFLSPLVERDFRPSKPKSGLKRPIAFVREQSPSDELTGTIPPRSSLRSDYLSLVLPLQNDVAASETELCPVCQLPLISSANSAGGEASQIHHEASIAHQVCLAHKHPPSSVDRTRKGFIYLQSRGWDPDSRRGLGPSGEGILHPIKPTEKKDKAGIGAPTKAAKKTAKSEAPEKPKLLNTKQLRKQLVEDKKRKEKLERLFYSDGLIERYLGDDA